VKELSRGVLIVFEGIDGSGKTTQIFKVARLLKKHNYQVTVTHEPNHNSKWGQLIQNKVKKHREEVTPETELEWYLKDRKWDLENNILPALKILFIECRLSRRSQDFYPRVCSPTQFFCPAT
jgi:dTMP kinase